MRRQLEKILKPKTIAVIGASNKTGSVGYALLDNVLKGGFPGRIYPVNLHDDHIQGLKAYNRIEKVPEKIDLAIIAIPARNVPDVVEDCGKAGVGGLVIISAGFLEAGQEGKGYARNIMEIARRYGMRVIGPNCLGFIHPAGKINASFASKMALPGKLALISQSGALLTSILDWSEAQRVGFSYFVSIGSMVDVDFADLIDYLGTDAQTSCILIYMESLSNARRFMSAARSFARNKPIIVLKSGRSVEGGKAALSHTGSLAGNDAVYDAAFRRAGIIRVDTIAQLFNIAQALALQPRPHGNRMAIITNAGGPGVLATDYLARHGGQLARLSPKTLDALNKMLPPAWSHGNPIDLLGDASPEKYGEAIGICLKDEGVDAILTILTPQYMTDPTGTAHAVAKAAKGASKPVFAAWMGETQVEAGREILEVGRVPNYRYPESAVDAFLRIHQYIRDLEMLYETPPAIPHNFVPETAWARQLIDEAIKKGQILLSENEAKGLLQCYGIPVNPDKVCTSPEEAADFAVQVGFPVVLKVISPDISHKTEAGGVVLNLNSREAVLTAFADIHNRVLKRRPTARIEGILVEKMIRKPFELILGAKKDPVFGPVVVFGRGGVGVEVYKDTQMGLPPLNMALADQIVEGTQFFPLLRGYRGLPGVNLPELHFLICKFAYLVMDFPEIQEVDINPYLADHEGGIVVDARIVLDPTARQADAKPYQHLVISPYPGSQYSQNITLRDGTTVYLRPIRPEDEPAMERMLSNVSNDSLYMRFFGYIPRMSHAWMVRFTHIDYDREIAIVAEVDNEAGGRDLIGVVRIIEDAWRETAEYSILVADNWHGKGLGNIMTNYIFDIARQRKIKKIVASVLPNNTPMIHMFEKRGFKFDRSGIEIYDVELELT